MIKDYKKAQLAELYKDFDCNAADMAAIKCGCTACFDNEDDDTRYYFK